MNRFWLFFKNFIQNFRIDTEKTFKSFLELLIYNLKRAIGILNKLRGIQSIVKFYLEEEKSYLSDDQMTSTSIEKLKTVFVQRPHLHIKLTPTLLLLASPWQPSLVIMLQMEELKIISKFIKRHEWISINNDYNPHYSIIKKDMKSFTCTQLQQIAKEERSKLLDIIN